MEKRLNYIQAFAVIRIDKSFLSMSSHMAEYESEGELLPAAGPPGVTIKEVLRTAEEARREVVRLNELNGDKDRTYYWQSTHVFPNGGSHGSASSI